MYTWTDISYLNMLIVAFRTNETARCGTATAAMLAAPSDLARLKTRWPMVAARPKISLHTRRPKLQPAPKLVRPSTELVRH